MFSCGMSLWQWPFTWWLEKRKRNLLVMDRLSTLTSVGPRIPQMLIWNSFAIQIHCDLDIWASDPKRSIEVVYSSWPFGLSILRSRGPRILHIKTFDRMTWKKNSCLLVMTYGLFRSEESRPHPGILQILVQNGFPVQRHCDIDLWPNDQKTKKVYPHKMPNLPTKSLCLCMFTLPITNCFVYWWIDRLTDKS